MALAVLGCGWLIASGCNQSVVAPKQHSAAREQAHSRFQHTATADSSSDDSLTAPFIWDQD